MQVNENVLTADITFNSELILGNDQNKMKTKDSHTKAPETKDATFDDDGGVVNFNKRFMYLCSIFNFY